MGSVSVYGTGSDFLFRVDEHGLSISGKGRPIFSLSLFYDTHGINNLPAEWSIYLASEAAELARDYSFDVTDLKYYLDLDAVKITAKPVGVIRHYEGPPRQLYFIVFLPDRQFAHTWELIKLIGAASSITYQLKFTFDEFMPRKIPEHPERISYDEWLSGRPCVIKDFVFELNSHGRDDVIANRAGT